MGKQKGDPEVASIFSGDCSQREYPVFYPLRLLGRFLQILSVHPQKQALIDVKMGLDHIHINQVAITNAAIRNFVFDAHVTQSVICNAGVGIILANLRQDLGQSANHYISSIF